MLCKLREFFSSLGAQGMINGTSMDMCHIYKCKLDYVILRLELSYGLKCELKVTCEWRRSGFINNLHGKRYYIVFLVLVFW